MAAPWTVVMVSLTLALAFLAAPLAADAQPAMPTIGFVRSSSIEAVPHMVAAFRQGLKDTGYLEGQNVAIEFRSADDHYDKLPAIVTELLRRPVAVLVVNSAVARLAKAATTTVPIVFATGGDPVREHLVASFNRPGGNMTGVSFFGSELGAKKLEVFRELVCSY
jgi:putative tryptophan/tyrosine transport system substrate-binding protein